VKAEIKKGKINRKTQKAAPQVPAYLKKKIGYIYFKIVLVILKVKDEFNL
jgi:hypothetical protein